MLEDRDILALIRRVKLVTTNSDILLLCIETERLVFGRKPETVKYLDRRDYMRGYMQRWRAKKKAKKDANP